MARYIAYDTATGLKVANGDTGNKPPPTAPAGTTIVHDGEGGDLTPGEYDVFDTGEKPTWDSAQPVGSRALEDPYPRVRFTPDVIDVNVGDAAPDVSIRSEKRDGTLIPFNGTYLIYKVENGQPLPLRVTLTDGRATLSVDTSRPRFVRVGNQENAQGQLRAIAVRPLRITVADSDL